MKYSTNVDITSCLFYSQKILKHRQILLSIIIFYYTIQCILIEDATRFLKANKKTTNKFYTHFFRH